MKRGHIYGLGAAMQLAATIVWVAIQTIMLSLPALTAARAAEGGTRAIVICTGSELRTIALDENGKPAKTPDRTIRCPWGTQFGGIGQIVADTPAPDMPEAVLVARVACSARGQFAGSTSARLFESRAPPCA